MERKFDVDDSIASPTFVGVDAITHADKALPVSLEAVYFDTPSRDLLANRITLRRRTGGTDSGWHLKLPAGVDARTELHAPLRVDAHGRDGEIADPIPPVLLDPVLAVVRDRPLSPIARISTVREVTRLRGPDGTALAEFCDDRVTARTGGDPPREHRWREWELELVDDDVEALDPLEARLRAAGARPAQYGSKLARALGAAPPDRRRDRLDPLHRAIADHLDQLLVWDRAVRADADDAVHQMRVHLRRIRSLLQVLAGFGGTARYAQVVAELRWLAGLLGVPRDAEVLGQRYRQALQRLPPDLLRGRVTQRLVDGAADRYRAGRAEALTAMRSARYFRLLDGLDGLLAEPSVTGRGDTDTARVGVDAAYRRVRKAAKTARAAAPAERDEALHRIRKAAKRLRYTAEATNAPRVAEQAKAIQALLGDHQDSVVSRAHLLAEAAAAHAAGEDTFTFGVLYQQEDDLAGNCRAQLEPALAELAAAVDELAPGGGRAGL